MNYVNWRDAARVANWLTNGATSSSSTETGAYAFNGQTTGIAPAMNPGAVFSIPTEDQWYEAAYYMGSGTNAGYWQDATQVTGATPTEVNATPVGIGTSGSVSPVTSGNYANDNSAADWNSLDGNAPTVGTNGRPERVRRVRHERECL